MATIRITHARLQATDTGEALEDEVTLVLREGRVAAIEPDPEATAAAADTVDARGGWVLPGWVNAHSHAYSALARGADLHDVAPRDFVELLQALWWRWDACLEQEDIEVSATLAALDGLRHGVTTVIDHHASYGCIAGSLDAVARGFATAGQRSVVAFEVSDRAGPEAARAALAENLRFAAQSLPDPWCLGSLLGLHASFTLGDATLERAAAIVREHGLRVHVHLAEDVADRIEGTTEGSGVVARLRDAGVLSPGSLVAHGVHLSASELRELGRLGAVLVHNPRSNMNNGVGRLDVTAATRAGVLVVLGTDGYGYGVLDEARVGTLVQRQAPRLGDGSAVAAAVLRGMPQLADLLRPGLGTLRPGAPADVVVTDYVPPTPLHADNVWAHLMFGEPDRRVRTVFVNGERVIDEGRSTRIDEKAFAARAREHAAAVWQRFARRPPWKTIVA